MSISAFNSPSNYVRWWPLGQLDLEAGRQLFANSLAKWEKKWLSTSHLQLRVGKILQSGENLDLLHGAHLWSYTEYGCDQLWIMALPSACTALVNQVLDLPDAFLVTTALSKSTLIASLEQTIVDELLEGLAGAMAVLTEKSAHVAHPSNKSSERSAVNLTQGGVSFDVYSSIGQLMFSIVCSAPLLRNNINMQAFSASNERHASDQIEQRGTALLDLKVGVHASLGHVQLTIPQLTTLAVGDVITLTRSLESAIPIVVTDTHEYIAQGILGRTGDKFSLQLT